MKILHSVLSEGFYGSERYCLELAAGQARAGHDVAVLVIDGSACHQEFIRAVEAIGDRKPQLLTLPRWLPAFLTGPTVKRIIDRFTPDLVHTHLKPAAQRVGEAAQALGLPHVATLHTNFEPSGHGVCDGLICIAEWQRKALPPSFAGEVAVVSNWVPASITDALARIGPADVAAVRALLRADDTTIVFGCAGQLLPEKGMDRLIRCFRAAFPLGTEPVRIVIAGGGPMRADIEELCERDPRVALVGMQTEIAAVYRAIDVYVSAARFEPFGLAIIEAMAAGCPLVLTRTEGPREYVEDPRVRWADANDEVTLVDHMRALAAGPRERMDYDLSRFTPERALAEIEAFYTRTLARKSGRGA